MKPAYECFANKRATGQTGSSMQVNKDTNPLKLNMGINTSTSACIR
jgi:hypothetical protein